MSDVIANLMKSVFVATRDPRSPEYQQGCEAILKYRLHGTKPAQPYALGTAQADAWFAGTGEGHFQATKLRPADDEKPNVPCNKLDALFEQLQPIPPQDQLYQWTEEQSQRFGVPLDTIYRALAAQGIRVQRNPIPAHLAEQP